MKAASALVAGMLFCACLAFAQIQPSGTQPPPVHHEASVPAKKPATTSPAATTEKSNDAAKDAAIRHLMEITQTSRLGDNIAAFLTDRVRAAMSQRLSAEKLSKFMDTFKQNLAATHSSDAVDDAIVPIYAKAFSMEDIEALVKFYESPLGQRVVKTLPHVAEDSQNTGMDIGQKAALGVLQQMTGEYPELKDMLGPAAAPEAPGGPGAAPAPAPQPNPAPKQP